MKTSENINELADALCEAQFEMVGAVKDSNNPFFNKAYADLGSVIKAIKDPFVRNGLSYTQFPFTTDSGAGVCTRLMHKSGQWLEMEYALPAVKKDPQSFGSAITYARRYALQSIAGIPAKDDDAESAMDRSAISEDQVIEIEQLIKVSGADKKRFLNHANVKSTNNILAVDFERLKKNLQTKLDQKKQAENQ